MAKTLSLELHGSEKSLIRLDMSEYEEKHSVSRLIGSPPGYVGHNEGDQTRQVSENPKSVILFDQVEKASVAVFNTLLQVLDDGRLTDGNGEVVDFRSRRKGRTAMEKSLTLNPRLLVNDFSIRDCQFDASQVRLRDAMLQQTYYPSPDFVFDFQPLKLSLEMRMKPTVLLAPISTSDVMVTLSTDEATQGEKNSNLVLRTLVPLFPWFVDFLQTLPL